MMAALGEVMIWSGYNPIGGSNSQAVASCITHCTPERLDAFA